MKRGYALLGILVLGLIILPLTSAGFSDFFDKITGRASSQPISLNITVTSGSAPTIPQVYNETSTVISGPNEGPSSSYILINFTAYDADGFGNLNDSSAQVNVTKSGETNRTNATCAQVIDFNTNYANYTCNITMWWWDAPGNWTMHASIKDLNGNSGSNSSANFSVGTTDGLKNNISSLTWPSISPGASDLPSNELSYLNNSGNMNQWLQVNATNLIGESNSAYALGANNFSVNGTGWCMNTSTMVAQTYVNISDAILPKGNYTINDGTAQEILYFCLESSNNDLIAQYYSTQSTGSWTVKVVNQ